MVKNTVGGSKTKGFARKSFQKSSSSVVRLPNNVLEKFAIVTKLFGQGRCQVITEQQITLNCVIRNKFKARFKNSNLVSIHSIILVGLRDWETPDFKICDLLEVYSADDILHFRNIPYVLSIIENFDRHNHNNNHNNTIHQFEFSNDDNNNIDHTPHTTPILHNEHAFNKNDFDDIIDDI
jgi:hypothetical protein